MKNSGVCPKCQSTDLKKLDGFSSGFHINVIRLRPFVQVVVDRFVCLNCGFTEEWISGPVGIQQLRQYFAKKKRPLNPPDSHQQSPEN